MTEKEIMEMQEQRGNKEFFLMLVGKFFLAYGHGAFALSRGTGYRVGAPTAGRSKLTPAAAAPPAGSFN